MNDYLRKAAEALPGIAAVVALISPAVGFAHPLSPPGGAPPIAVRSCEVAKKYVSSHPHWYGWYHSSFDAAPATNGLRIVFANHTNVPATEVGFRVAYRGAIEYVHDVGTFSPGIAIDHSYSRFVDFAFLGSQPNGCRPVYAKFADGSIWFAGPEI